MRPFYSLELRRAMTAVWVKTMVPDGGREINPQGDGLQSLANGREVVQSEVEKIIYLERWVDRKRSE